MATTVGHDQFFKHSTSAGGGRSASGIVTGGSPRELSEIQVKRSIGNWKPAQLREGMVSAEGTVNLDVQSTGILALAERDVYGDLTYFDIEYGTTSESQIHKYCKVDTLTLECARNETLRATLGWKARYSQAGSGGSHSPSGNPVLQWFEAAISGISCELVGVTFNVSHNLELVGVMDNTQTVKRNPKYVEEKAQDCTVNLRFLSKDATNMMAAAISYIASVAVTFVGTATVTLTMTNLKPEAKNQDLSPEDLIEYGADYQVTDFSF